MWYTLMKGDFGGIFEWPTLLASDTGIYLAYRSTRKKYLEWDLEGIVTFVHAFQERIKALFLENGGWVSANKNSVAVSKVFHAIPKLVEELLPE